MDSDTEEVTAPYRHEAGTSLRLIAARELVRNPHLPRRQGQMYQVDPLAIKAFIDGYKRSTQTTSQPMIQLSGFRVSSDDSQGIAGYNKASAVLRLDTSQSILSRNVMRDLLASEKARTQAISSEIDSPSRIAEQSALAKLGKTSLQDAIAAPPLSVRRLDRKSLSMSGSKKSSTFTL